MGIYTEDVAPSKPAPSSPPRGPSLGEDRGFTCLVPLGLMLLYHHLGAGPKPIGCASHWATFRAPCHTNLERAVGGCKVPRSRCHPTLHPPQKHLQTPPRKNYLLYKQ